MIQGYCFHLGKPREVNKLVTYKIPDKKPSHLISGTVGFDPYSHQGFLGFMKA